MLFSESIWHKVHSVKKHRSVFIIVCGNYCIGKKWTWSRAAYLGYVFMTLHLIHSLCYRVRYKELLIENVFKCGLEVIMKLDYFKWNAAKDSEFNLRGGKNVVDSIPKWITWIEKVVRSWDWKSGELGLGLGSVVQWLCELWQITL